MVSRKLIAAVIMTALVVAIPGAAPGAGLSRARLDVETAQAHPAGLLRCEIEVEDYGGSVRLQGIVFSIEAAQGAYDMLVSGSDNGVRPEIRQQGDFTSSANRPMRLGIVELRKDSGGYNAVLTLVWNGGEYRCGRRIGEAWS